MQPAQLHPVLIICAGLGHSYNGNCRTVVGCTRDLPCSAAALVSDACTTPLSLQAPSCPAFLAKALRVRGMDCIPRTRTSTRASPRGPPFDVKVEPYLLKPADYLY
jgi:hypothetical protein